MAIERTAAAWNASRITMAGAARDGAKMLSQAGIESAALDAEVLLRNVLGLQNEQFYLERDMPVSELAQARYWESLQQRARHKPVAYITGIKEFWSLDLLVTSDVLIPRPETELLVEVALGLAQQAAKAKSQLSDVRDQNDVALCSMPPAPRGLPERPVKILEVGTGSGAIAIALAKELPNAEITATDISAAALEVARTNAARQGVSTRIEFLHGEFFTPLADRASFHLVVSNPPYIRSGELQTLPLEVRDWEPVIALDGGEDGLEHYRRFAAETNRYLATGAYVALEIGADMAAGVSRLYTEMNRYAAPAIYQDYAGRDRVLAARKLK